MLREHPTLKIERIVSRMDRVKDRHVEKNLERIGALKLAHKIAAEHGVLFEVVFLSRVRMAAVSRARAHFCALLRWSTGLSFPDIGAVLDLDHSSVVDAVERWERVLNS